MKRFTLLAALGLGVLVVIPDGTSAARPRRVSRTRTVRTVRTVPTYRPINSRYQYTPLATGSTSQNRVRTSSPSSPRPIPFQQPRWVDPGAYRTNFPANYGPGTGKSGPAGQRLYIHRVPYQGSNDGYTPGVIRPRTNPPAAGGTPSRRSYFGYDDNRSKTSP